MKVSSQSAWYTSRTVQMKDELQTVTKQLAATKRCGDAGAPIPASVCVWVSVCVCVCLRASVCVYVCLCLCVVRL